MQRVVCLILVSLFACACREGAREIVVTEKRKKTLWDETYPLDIKDVAPASWRRVVPLNEFRVLDYRFGDEGGEVYVSLSGGGVLPNINRWLGQFGEKSLANIEGLETLEVLGERAFLVKASGTYKGRQGEQPNRGLIGVVCPVDDGVLTVKMLAGELEISRQEGNFQKYCENLAWAESLKIEKREGE